MGVLRRTASAVAGTTMLAVSALGLTIGGASAGTVLALGTTVGVPNHAGYGYDGQPATQTLLQRPVALATDSSGDLFVADAAAHVVRVVTPDGIAHVVAGVPGVAGSDADGRAATSSHLTSPSGLLVVPGGVLIADPGAHRVVLLHGGVLSAYAGTGAAGSPASVSGQSATLTPFQSPTGLATNGAGTVYVSDPGDETVWRISPQGAVDRVAGVPGRAGYTRSGDVATSSPLSDPTGLAWQSGHLVIADTGNHRLRAVSASGYLGDLVGAPTLSEPTGLLVAGGGQLYVADAAGRVGLVAGGGVSWYAGASASGYSPDGTLAANAGLVDPTALAISANGRLLVAETGTSSVRDLRVAAGPPQQPAAPTGSVGDRTIDVSWRPVDDGGSPVTTWTVQAYAGGRLVDTVSVGGNQYSARLSGLSDNAAYSLTLTAANTYGQSPASAVSDPLVPHAPPDYTTVGGGQAGGGSGGSGPVLTFPTDGPTQAPGNGTGPDGTGDAGGDGTTTYLHLTDPGLVTAPVLPVPTPTQGPSDDGIGPKTAIIPTAVPYQRPTAPVAGLPTAAATVQSVPLLPVRSFADAATDVATVGKKSVVPLVLVGVLGAFLLLQGAVDRRDPTLSQAPLHADRGLEFGPA